jgi:predicted trehalose synthase
LQDLVPIDLPENCWLGIETDGSCTVLHPDEEPKWRASRATRAIEDSQLLSQSSPIRAVCALHAAAALVGLQVAKIHGALAKVRKSPSEPLEVTVQALVETLEKERVQQR